MTIDTTNRRHWRDAEAAVEVLRRRPADRRSLLLLATLPLLSEEVIQRLAGLRGGASVYRGLRRLADDGLIRAVRPPHQPGHGPRLWYLTDLGLAVVALDQGVEPEPLARRNRLRGADLLALLPGLPQLQAGYELLAALAASRPGQPNLLAWERPWRRRYQRPTAKAPVAATLPAYAALAWEGRAGAYLLLPDRGTAPLRLYAPALDHLLVLRGVQAGELPTLVIATTDPGRATAWWALLEEARRARSEAPLAACIATWDDLRQRPETLADPATEPVWPVPALVQQVRLRPRRPRRSAGPLPRFVDAAVFRPGHGSAADGPGRVVLGLSPSALELLDLVGAHPFLPPDRLAVLLGWPLPAVQRRCRQLLARALLRRLEPGEVKAEFAGSELLEATADGLALVAARQGLSLAVAVRANGLAGGGPDQPIGSRQKLLKELAHTRGADDLFVSLCRTARARAAAGGDDALVVWRNAAACCRGPVRPDGYGIYRQKGERYGFFLEYDRGTMSARDYRAKFATYDAYWASGRFERDYDGFPTILVVTTDNAAEERIARAARAAAVGRAAPLPLLLTCRWRLDDERNPQSLLGPIWREPSSTERRYWPPVTGSGTRPVVLSERRVPIAGRLK
jgi:hypothetical protein